MRRILLICASAALLTLPAAASASGAGRSTHGVVVVRKAAGDGGVNGPSVVTVVVHGFVLGRISPRAEARVDVYHLQTTTGGGAPQAAGSDVSRRVVRWRRFSGIQYSGSGFRFRAIGGWYRVVVRGSGVYLFAGGHGSVWLHGSSVYPHADGSYALGGAAFRSLPGRRVKFPMGRH
jgi:hypothetical protein